MSLKGSLEMENREYEFANPLGVYYKLDRELACGYVPNKPFTYRKCNLSLKQRKARKASKRARKIRRKNRR